METKRDINQLVDEVITKVREMYRYVQQYHEILCKTPQVNVWWNAAEKRLVLENIEFSDYDEIIIDENSIVFKKGENRTRNKTVLIEYRDFEELLNL